MPKCGIHTVGGREFNLRDVQAAGLLSGINGMLIGGYLTTGGHEYADDLRIIHDLGLTPLSAKDLAHK